MARWSGEGLSLCLTESVHTVVLQKSIPAQSRQLILYISNNKGQVDEFWWDWTFAKRLSTRVYPCEHIQKSNIGLLPRKRAKSQRVVA